MSYKVFTKHTQRKNIIKETKREYEKKPVPTPGIEPGTSRTGGGRSNTGLRYM